jgi:2-dehydro-3-deoxyphosphooctonate aldolase (KDO 8-P synthase)
MNSKMFFTIAGPCVIEDEETPFQIAETMVSICGKLEIPYIFKASYRKANRTSSSSFTGIGDEKALQIIKSIGEKYQIFNNSGYTHR